MSKAAFKGWDWTELFQLFPGMEEKYKREVDDVPADQYCKAEREFGQRFASAIACYSFEHSDEETKQFVKDLRTFLKELVKGSGYYKPYFKGILKIKEPDVFLQMFAWNVTCMWT